MKKLLRLEPQRTLLPSLMPRICGRMMLKLRFMLVPLLASLFFGIKSSNAQTCPAWSNVGSADFSASNAEFISMAISSSGTPYVIFRDNASSARATVMKFDGTNWVIVGSAGFSAGHVQFTQIAIDGSGTPYAGYLDVANGSKPTVMKFDGTNWVAVGAVAFSGAN